MGVVRIGPAGWNYRDWKGVFYPNKRPRGFSELEYLAEYFDLAEINSSFYGPPAATSAAKWVHEVRHNREFIFTAKLWQRFTHETGGNLADEKLVRAGFDELQNAGKLGAVLLQFPYTFHYTKDNLEALKKLTERFRQYPLVLEIRHGGWDQPEVYEFLRQQGVGFCNIDQPHVGKSLQETAYVTSRIAYIRLHGRNASQWFDDRPNQPHGARYDYQYSRAELAPWVERIHKISSESDTVFVATNNHPAAKSLQTGLLLAEMLLKNKVKVPSPLAEAYPDLCAIALEIPKTTLF